MQSAENISFNLFHLPCHSVPDRAVSDDIRNISQRAYELCSACFTLYFALLWLMGWQWDTLRCTGWLRGSMDGWGLEVALLLSITQKSRQRSSISRALLRTSTFICRVIHKCTSVGGGIDSLLFLHATHHYRHGRGLRVFSRNTRAAWWLLLFHFVFWNILFLHSKSRAATALLLPEMSGKQTGLIYLNWQLMRFYIVIILFVHTSSGVWWSLPGPACPAAAGALSLCGWSNKSSLHSPSSLFACQAVCLSIHLLLSVLHQRRALLTFACLQLTMISITLKWKVVIYFSLGPSSRRRIR